MRTEPPQGTLDERIAMAEERLVAHERAVRQGAQALLLRAQEATRPRRMVRPAAYALGALALLVVLPLAGFLFRKRTRAPLPSRRSD